MKSFLINLNDRSNFAINKQFPSNLRKIRFETQLSFFLSFETILRILLVRSVIWNLLGYNSGYLSRDVVFERGRKPRSLINQWLNRATIDQR